MNLDRVTKAHSKDPKMKKEHVCSMHSRGGWMKICHEDSNHPCLVQPLEVHLGSNEAIHLSHLFKALFSWLASTVSSLDIHSNEKWVGLVWLPSNYVLQSGNELERVKGNHTVIMVTSSQKNTWVLSIFAWLDILERRDLVQPLKLFFVIRAPIVSDPCMSYGKAVKAKHIHDTNLTDGHTKQFRALVDACTNKKPTITSTLDRKVLRGSVLLSNQVLCTALKVIEAVLLDGQRSCLVPFLAVFTSSTNVGNGNDTAKVTNKDEPRGTEGGCERDVEATIAVEKSWVGTIKHQILLVHNEHWNLGAVLGLIKDLLSDEFVWVEPIHGGTKEHSRIFVWSRAIVLIDCVCRKKGSKGVEESWGIVVASAIRN
eukprot:m.357639 g.357639  ORF g.357639 m.357639 type:complete len:371 (-) comp17888_c0_seq1:1171-2283(-)